MERDERRLLPVVQAMTSSDERRVTATRGDYERQVETPTSNKWRLLRATKSGDSYKQRAATLSGDEELRATTSTSRDSCERENDNYERRVTTTSRKQRVETPTSDERRATPSRYKGLIGVESYDYEQRGAETSSGELRLQAETRASGDYERQAETPTSGERQLLQATSDYERRLVL